MKRIRAFFTALILLCAAFAPADAAIRIGVDRFRTSAPGIDPDVADALTEMFITELTNTGTFEVYERSQLEKIAREQRLSSGGMVSQDTLIRAGRLRGVQWIITGAVTQFDERATGGVLPLHRVGVALGNYVGTVTLDIRTIDTTTGAITMALREVGSAARNAAGAVYRGVAVGGMEFGGVGSQAAMKAVKKAVRQLERRIGGVDYHVIKVDRKRALIDMGSSKGAAKGDLFGVYEEGKLIRGVNGEIVDAERAYHALLKVVEVKPTYSACAYVKGKGKSDWIRVGDFIERVDKGAPARALEVTEERLKPSPATQAGSAQQKRVSTSKNDRRK